MDYKKYHALKLHFQTRGLKYKQRSKGIGEKTENSQQKEYPLQAPFHMTEDQPLHPE